MISTQSELSQDILFFLNWDLDKPTEAFDFL
jgi:hypothetical protein